MLVKKSKMPYNLLKDNASAISFIQRWLDPTIAVLWLLALLEFQEEPFRVPYRVLSIVSFLLIFLVFGATGAYHSYRANPPKAIASKIVLGWGVVVAILLFLGYITKTSEEFSRVIVLSWVGLVPISLFSVHLAIWKMLRHFRLAGRNSRSAVIVGISKVSQYLGRQLSKTPELGIELHGFFDDKIPSAPRPLQGTRLLGKLKELPEYVRDRNIDIVYLTGSSDDEYQIRVLIESLRDTTACVYFVPNILMADLNLMQARYYEINGVPVIPLWEIPFSEIQYFLKRTVDIIVGSLALAMLSPIMIVIAIAIKLDSPGPVLFKQRRYGFNGQEILVYKFRSMTVAENEDTVKQAQKNDPRVTKVGAVLRRTSLDELPQFINVLQGRMSIVGPRPHAVAHNEHYRRLISGYMLRHKVKPGITGWAQVHGFRGETDTIDKMKKRIEYDLDYMKRWSLSLDFEIILRTFLVWFQGTNAY
jgi:putative colanic acid biosynthesis UDP-glucose lipid carrier transferase